MSDNPGYPTGNNLVERIISNGKQPDANAAQVQPGEVWGPELLNNPGIQHRALVNIAAANMCIAHTLSDGELQFRLNLRDESKIFEQIAGYLTLGELILSHTFKTADGVERTLFTVADQLAESAQRPGDFPELCTYIQILRAAEQRDQ